MVLSFSVMISFQSSPRKKSPYYIGFSKVRWETSRNGDSLSEKILWTNWYNHVFPYSSWCLHENNQERSNSVCVPLYVDSFKFASFIYHLNTTRFQSNLKNTSYLTDNRIIAKLKYLLVKQTMFNFDENNPLTFLLSLILIKLELFECN